MKGIVVAGGRGTRLAPLTKDGNKHLLPVWKKRMVEYPVDTIISMGVKDICIVTGGNQIGSFIELLKDGSDRNINSIIYAYQSRQEGIADAINCASNFIEKAREPFTQGEPCVVMLGDNYFDDPIKPPTCFGFTGCTTLLKQVDKPWDFGIAELDSEGRIISIEEKPKKPKSNYAILGCYFFDSQVWDFIKKVKPSLRGEKEITGILNQYLEKGQLNYQIYNGFWSDMGTFESWINVAQYISKKD